MATIQIRVNEELLSRVGLGTVKNYLERQIEALKMQLVAGEISSIIKDRGIDIDAALDDAKSRAWDEYKALNLKGII
jgi:hypothetical protein